jgi:hypothetical protein
VDHRARRARRLDVEAGDDDRAVTQLDAVNVGGSRIGVDMLALERLGRDVIDEDHRSQQLRAGDRRLARAVQAIRERSGFVRRLCHGGVVTARDGNQQQDDRAHDPA